MKRKGGNKEKKIYNSKVYFQPDLFEDKLNWSPSTSEAQTSGLSRAEGEDINFPQCADHTLSTRYDFGMLIRAEHW